MQEGAYRLIRNPHVSAAAIRKAGAMRTVELAQAFPELLAIEDTTSLSYRHQVAEELGKLGATEDKSPRVVGSLCAIAGGRHVSHCGIAASGVVDAPG